jgi:hypothetical protein
MPPSHYLKKKIQKKKREKPRTSNPSTLNLIRFFTSTDDSISFVDQNPNLVPDPVTAFNELQFFRWVERAELVHHDRGTHLQMTSSTPGPLVVVRPPPDRPTWGWPNHPRPNKVANHHLWGGLATPATFFFFLIFFLNKIYDEGILGIKTSNGLNCHNLNVWGVKCHILNFGGKSENE